MTQERGGESRRQRKAQAKTHVDVSLHVKVDAVFDHQRLKRLLTGQANVLRCVVLNADIPRSVETDDNPGRPFAIDGSEIFLKPIVLFVRASEWTVICTAINAPDAVWRLDTDGEVSFTVEENEVGEAVVEGVPKVANAPGFCRRHAEVVD